MITSRQKLRAQAAFHARQAQKAKVHAHAHANVNAHTKTKTKAHAHAHAHEHSKTKAKVEPNFDILPDDIKERLVADGENYLVHGGILVSDLNFRYSAENQWEWSPDNENWQTVRNEIVEAGDDQGDSPVQSNIDLLNRLHSIEEGLSSLGTRKYDEVKWYFRGFISSSLDGGWWMNEEDGCSDAEHEYVASLPRIPLVNALGVRCFRTDSRDYSTTWDARSRFNMKVVFDGSGVSITPTVTDSAGESVDAPYSDYTNFYICKDSHLTTGDCGDTICHKRSSASDLHIDSLICYDGSTWSETCTASSVLATFHIYGDPGDPCTPPGTPGIDFYGGFTLAVDGHIYGDGAVDAFPWFESGVITPSGETSVWTLAPEAGKTPFNLYGGANRVFHISSGF